MLKPFRNDCVLIKVTRSGFPALLLAFVFATALPTLAAPANGTQGSWLLFRRWVGMTGLITNAVLPGRRFLPTRRRW